jgi:hypothetical protein
MTRSALLLSLLLAACAGSSTSTKKAEPSKQPTVSPTVAVVDGVALTQAELDAVMSSRKLERDAALEELIDTQLTLARAKKEGLGVENKAYDEPARAAFELSLARKLGLALPEGRISLIVDHAWVKDAPKAKDKAANKKLLERLRTSAMAGTRIPEGWKTLGAAGELWHIGDHEEYGYEVLPREARDTLAGKVSPIAVGDGGLHLFQVYERKELPPPAEEVRGILRAALRDEAKIDKR